MFADTEICITHKCGLSLPTNSLGTSLKRVRHVKDLFLSSDLSWSEQVNVTVNKANKRLGLVHRIAGSSNPSTISTVYKSLVRPVRKEGDATVWRHYS